MEEKTAMKKLKTHDKYEDDWLTKKEAPYYYKECIWVFRFIGIFSLLNAVLLAVETGICIWIYARGVWKKKNPPPIKGK